MENGILCRKDILKRQLDLDDLSNISVQERRSDIEVYFSDRYFHYIHSAVPLYFITKTPTQYHYNQNEIFIIEINKEIINDNNIAFAFSDGNYACSNIKTYHKIYDLSKLPWHILEADEGNLDFKNPEIKKQRCCEFLIRPMVMKKYFDRILVKNLIVKQKLLAICNDYSNEIPIFAWDKCFFE
jgi:hypothetical protein